MAALLLEGWLVKDGNMMGSWKNRYCTLTFQNNEFEFEYYVSDDKKDKKGVFTIARASGFKKAPNSGEIKNCFSIEVAESGGTGRKAGAKVVFSAPSVEAFVLWDKAFAEAKAPVGVMPGVGRSFGKPELMVLGASGYIGVATVKSLCLLGDYNIKAGVRDVSSAKNISLVMGGAQLVQADLSKPKTLLPALRGVKVVFVVVPGHLERTALSIAGIKACKEAGVEHIVVLSICSADKAGTLFADQFSPIEAATKTCGLPYTIVRLPMFMENVLGQMQSIATEGRFCSPLESRLKQNCVSVTDVGDAVSKIMSSPGAYANQTLNLCGDLVCEKDFAEAFSAALGSPVTHVCVSYLDSKASMLAMGMPEWQVDGVIELYKLCADEEPCLTSVGDLSTILGRPLASASSLAASVSTVLQALKTNFDSDAAAAGADTAAQLESLQLAAQEAREGIQAAARNAQEKASAASIAKHVQKTRLMLVSGGLVLKKMSTESAFKSRFVWIDDDDRKLYWSKSETKEAQCKSVDLIHSVEISRPEFSPAKPASVFGSAEPEGFTFSVTETGKASLDLKIEGTVEDAFAWINSIKVLCGHIPPTKRGSIVNVTV